MKIAVAGAGFVGLVHAAVMAKQGHTVILFDVNEKRIQNLNDFIEGKTEILPIHEEGLAEILRFTAKNHLLECTIDQKRAIRESTIIFIAVGTPPDAQGKADVKYVEALAEEIGKILQEYPSYKLIINKSTVPVGTAKKVKAIIQKYYQGDFDLASNPETLAEGQAVQDALRPNRIIVGVDSEKAKHIFQELYASFFPPQQEKIFFMSPESAELTKYACNTYLASQVVLTNVFANIAKKSGANWRDMAPAILADERIGRFVHPGIGFGGSCFRKDVSQLYNTSREKGNANEDSAVLQAILEQNEKQKKEIIYSLEKRYGKDFSGKIFAVWGLSFKKDTNDIRDAASLTIIPELLRNGARIQAHDPEAKIEFIEELKKQKIDLSSLNLYDEKYKATENADALLILNDWKEYRQPDLKYLKGLLKEKNIFDGKDVLNYLQMKEEDFNYFSIGRPDIIK